MSDSSLIWNPADALSADQRERLAAYERLLVETNQQINLISRSDEDRIHLHHTIHSLALSYRPFPAGSRVVDWGTGGGLPGIPLAIRFPEVSFFLVDSTRKKILAVRRMIRQLDLNNVETWHGRAEEWPGEAAYSVSRAAASLESLWHWFNRVRNPSPATSSAEEWSPGLLALKGGDLSDEITTLKNQWPQVTVDITLLQPLLASTHFAGKAIVHVSA